MQRFVYQIALACLAIVGCAAHAQQAEQMPTEPTAAPVTAAPEAALPYKNEAQLKEELIASADHLSDKAKGALRTAANDMSFKFLQGYMNFDGHHAYDGHTALDHANLKE